MARAWGLGVEDDRADGGASQQPAVLGERDLGEDPGAPVAVELGDPIAVCGTADDGQRPAGTAGGGEQGLPVTPVASQRQHAVARAGRRPGRRAARARPSDHAHRSGARAELGGAGSFLPSVRTWAPASARRSAGRSTAAFQAR